MLRLSVLVLAVVIISCKGHFLRSRPGSLPELYRSDTCGGKYNGTATTQYYGVDGYESYLLSNSTATENGINIKLSVCTRQRDGLLLRIGSPTDSSALAIEVKNRFLRVLLQEGNWKQECVLWLKNQSISDGRVYVVEVQLRKDLQLRVKVTSQDSVLVDELNAGECITKLPTLKEVDLGGDPIDWSPDPIVQNNFVGCLRDIRFNGERLDQVATLDHSQSTSLSCDIGDNVCQDLCPPPFVMTSDQQCVCPPGKEATHQGTHCQSSCNCHSCQNGGTCQLIDETVTCDCPPGYLGDQCQLFYNVCHNDPCKNNATCQQNTSSANGFTCQCLPGYEGDVCEVKKNPLKMNEEQQMWIIILGGVIAGLLFLGLLIALGCYLRRRTIGRRKPKEENGKNSEEKFEPESVVPPIDNETEAAASRSIC